MREKDGYIDGREEKRGGEGRGGLSGAMTCNGTRQKRRSQWGRERKQTGKLVRTIVELLIQKRVSSLQE